MKPIIGITADIDEAVYKLKLDYVSAVVNAGGVPVVIPPLEKGGRGDFPMNDIARIADIINGLLVSGGDDLYPEYYNEDISVPLESLRFVRRERSDFEISLLREVIRKQKPVLGICYGMQLINVKFGGTLFQDIEFQIKGAIDHKKGRHDIKITQSFASAFNLRASAFVVNSFHHQAVKAIGEGLEVFAVSGDGLVEGFYKRDYPFLVGLQWHPERCFNELPSPNPEEMPALLLNEQSCDTLSLRMLETFVKKAEENIP